jgi:hypothetical protein
MVEPVRQDSSFAEKQESRPVRLLVVQGERGRRAARALASPRMQARRVCPARAGSGILPDASVDVVVSNWRRQRQ